MKIYVFCITQKDSLTYCDKVYELKDNKLTLKIHENFKNKTILITGGTGSFGQKCSEILLKYQPKK